LEKGEKTYLKLVFQFKVIIYMDHHICQVGMYYLPVVCEEINDEVAYIYLTLV